ncbi:MAG: cellulose synthase [Shinella sp.]|nr:MAG: cellulose synthase [Shinella sp.]
MKLSLMLLSAAAVAGSLVTVVTGGDTERQAVSADAISQRQPRLPVLTAQIDTEAIAARIRANSLAQGPAGIPPANVVTENAASVAQAQTLSPGAPTVSSPASPPASAAPAAGQARQPDLSALRYFAAQGDTARLQAEIARLRSLYPNWTPPADPLAVPVNGDQKLEAMWQLYSEGRYAEVRRAISDRQTAETGWQPPADLIERLDVAEARTRLVNASNLKQYTTVIGIGAATPSLLNCSDVDVLWRVAEAFVETERVQRGIDAYSYILKNCTDTAQRVATIQKAETLLPYADLQSLLAFEKTGPDGAREFDPLRDDLARRFVADANEKPDLTIAPEYLERLRRLAEQGQQATDSLLLGWYYVRHKDMTEAEKWFRVSRQKDDTASASQGLALTLIARNASAEAEDVMYRWRDDSEEANATYLASTANLLAGDPPPAVPEPVLQRVATAVLEKHYVPTAQQLGWYARAFGQWQTAARWFETALQWKPDDEPSAYGLVITRQQLNDRAGVDEIQRAWAGRSDRIARLGMLTNRTVPSAPVPQVVAEQASRPVAQQDRPVVVQQGYIAERAPAPVTRAPAPAKSARRGGCSATDTVSSLSPDQANMRGWCLMDMNRPMEAADAFEIALRSPSRNVREDAAYGQSLAYLRLGLTKSAAVAATKSPQRPERSSELQVAILANRALSAFDSQRYREAIVYLDQRAMLQPEPTDLMVLRGYAMLKLGMMGDARRLFEAVAATGNRDGMKGLADIEAMQNPQH